jgi:hypothetical protein
MSPKPPAAAAPPTAAAKPTRAPMTIEQACAREVTAPLTTYPLTVLDGVELRLGAATAPVVENMVNTAGKTFAQLTMRLDDDASVSCAVTPVLADFSTMMQTYVRLAGQSGLKPQASAMRVAVAQHRPIGIWDVTYTDKAGDYAVFHYGIVHIDSYTLTCALLHSGFADSFMRFMRTATDSARTKQVVVPPTYLAVWTINVRDIPVGMQYADVKRTEAGGFAHRRGTTVFFAAETMKVAVETSDLSNADAQGVFADTTAFVAENGEITEVRKLTRQGLGQVAYEFTRKGVTDRGVISGTVTSSIADAKEMRLWLAGAKSKPVITELREDPPRIFDAKYTLGPRKGTVLHEESEGKSTLCEINDEGICAKEISESKHVEISLISSFGQMPRLEAAGK